MPDDPASAPVRRIAQIINHRHTHSDASPAASAVEMARRIHLELVRPEQQLVAQALERVHTLTAMNGELTQRIDNLLLMNAKLVAENERLVAALESAKERDAHD
jgi:hypothetical protein